MYEEYARELSDKSQRVRNSFYAGVADGYLSKIKKETNGEETTALAKVNDDYEKLARKLAYTALTNGYRRVRRDYAALSAGRSAGKSLSIHGGIRSNGGMQRLLA